MACTIAENQGLRRLHADLGLPFSCHGARSRCVRGHAVVGRDKVLGARGAALGYCQALFHRTGTHAENTENVAKCLADADAPWRMSHELFDGYRGDCSFHDFVETASAPLRGSGRVPVVITALDPSVDASAVGAIFASTRVVGRTESVLVRLVLRGATSVQSAAELIRRGVREAKASGAMPGWWPLFQGDVDASVWIDLKRSLGDLWQYVNVAINPFVERRVLEVVHEQITVAQIPVGGPGDTMGDERVRMPAGMKLTGMGSRREWDVGDYCTAIQDLDDAPVMIVLGPSLLQWTQAENVERVRGVVPVIRRLCHTAWSRLPVERRTELLELSA